jgi:hypothetical protein
MSPLGVVVLVGVILILIGVLPTWGHSSKWGYYPSAGVGLVLFFVLILILFTNVFSSSA